MENANLTRKQQKIFAGNTTISEEQIAVFGSKTQTGTMAFSKDPDVIQNENWQNGWQNATVLEEAPFEEDFNAIDFVESYNLAYLFQKGIPEYSENTTYFKGSICLVINNDKPTLYYSKTDNNTGNNPATDSTNWANLYSYISSFISVNFALIDGSNLTKGFQFINSFDIQSGDVEIDINNLNDGARHIIYIDNLTTTNFVDNNLPYIQLGTDGVADSSNIYNYLILQQLTNNINNIFCIGNPSTTRFNISYNSNDNMTNIYDNYIIELSSFNEKYITIFVKRYMVNNENYLRYIEGKCIVENNNFNFLKFSSTLVSSNPFQTGSVKHYRII